MELLVKKLHSDAVLPQRMLNTAVGYDLTAYVKQAEGKVSRAIIPPHTVRVISTGLCCMLRGTSSGDRIAYLQLHSRSGLAKKCLTVANGPGIIDPDYTGEILVQILNSGYETHYIAHGDRIAQLIVAFAAFPLVVEVKEFAPTLRGDRGFGSTGQ